MPPGLYKDHFNLSSSTFVPYLLSSHLSPWMPFLEMDEARQTTPLPSHHRYRPPRHPRYITSRHCHHLTGIHPLVLSPLVLRLRRLSSLRPSSLCLRRPLRSLYLCLPSSLLGLLSLCRPSNLLAFGQSWSLLEPCRLCRTILENVYLHHTIEHMNFYNSGEIGVHLALVHLSRIALRNLFQWR